MTWAEYPPPNLDRLIEVKMRQRRDNAGWVSLRAKWATANAFGLLDFCHHPLGPDGEVIAPPTRVFLQTQPGKFFRYRIATPDRYASNGKPVSHRFGLSTVHRLKDLAFVGEAIERSGMPWEGLLKDSSAKLVSREWCLAAAAAHRRHRGAV